MNVTVEDNVIGTWFARLGVLAVLVGAAFGYRYAIDQGWIGPAARVLLGVLVGAGFLAGGHASRSRRWYPFASALSGGGIAILYLSTLAAHVRYELIGPPTALVALTGVALLGGALSVFYDSLPLSMLATVGAFAIPFLISSGSPDPTAALTYVLAVDLGIVYLAFAGRWPVLNKIGLLGSTALFAAVIGDVGLIEGIGFASALWLIFTMVPTVQVLRDHAHATALEAGLLIAVSSLYFAAGMYLLDGESSLARGVFTAALGLACGAFAALAQVDERTRPLLRDVMGAQAIAWLTLAGPIALDGPTVPLVWLVEGAMLMWLGGRADDARVTGLSIGLIVMGLLGSVDHISAYVPHSLLTTNDAAVAAASIVAIYATAWSVTRAGSSEEEWRRVLGMALMALASLITLGWLSREAAFEAQRWVADERAFATVQFTYSVLWAAYAALLLIFGIFKNVAWARYFGVGLFTITIVKMMSVDVWQLSILYRMVAFVALGALLIVCSFTYNRFRELIVGAPAPVGWEGDPPV